MNDAKLVGPCSLSAFRLQGFGHVNLLPPSISANYHSTSEPIDLKGLRSVIMSTKAKLTLLGTSLGALGIIVFVHTAQKTEKAVSRRHVIPALGAMAVLNPYPGHA